MRVLICGGRQFADADLLWKTMDDLSAATPICEVIVRGATGADTLAEHWAKDRRVPYRIFLANWIAYGRGASAIRNKKCSSMASRILLWRSRVVATRQKL